MPADLTVPAGSRVVVFTREGCHLCAEALEVVRSVEPEPTVLDVDARPEWAERFGTDVPVVFVDRRQVARWRIEADALTAALSRTTPMSQAVRLDEDGASAPAEPGGPGEQ